MTRESESFALTVQNPESVDTNRFVSSRYLLLLLVHVQELEEEEGKPYLAVFMMATYGEGDPTDNAMEFNEKLQENIIYSLYPMNTFKCLNKF